jgi:hypothetical protein
MAKSRDFVSVEKRPAPLGLGLRRRGVNFPAEFGHPGALWGAQGGLDRHPDWKKNQRPRTKAQKVRGDPARLVLRRDEDIQGYRGRPLVALGGCRGHVRARAALGLRPPAAGAAPRCHLTHCAAQYCIWTFQRGQSPACSFHGGRNALLVRWMLMAATSPSSDSH